MTLEKKLDKIRVLAAIINKSVSFREVKKNNLKVNEKRNNAVQPIARVKA